MSPLEPGTAEEARTWEPPPWGVPAEEARLAEWAARLAEWAEWADSATFSSTGLMSGYDKQEVDAFLSAVRDTFFGVGKPPVKSDDVRGKQFPTSPCINDSPRQTAKCPHNWTLLLELARTTR
jgi:DivIVA domain-containing protein